MAYNGLKHISRELINEFYDNSLFIENGKMGMKNNVFGTVLIPLIYDELPYTVPKGYYAVAINGSKYGIVKADGKGTVISPFIYDFICELGEGYYVGVYCVCSRSLGLHDGKERWQVGLH